MKIKKAAALALSLCMVTSLMACGSSDAESSSSADADEEALEAAALSLVTEGGHSDESGKEETVYVIADADGNTEQIIVENWIKNEDGSEELTDVTNLTDIENTKGDEDYTDNGDGTITWNTQGTDIYYEGTGTEELPVTVSVKYELDGKSVTADTLAGATGHLKITFSYTNNDSYKRTINGKTVTLYRPYIMVSGLILDNAQAGNVTVTNGKSINDGDRSIVVGLAMPGLSESLGLSDYDLDLEIPEEVVIEADVEDFELLTTLTLATGDALSELGLSDVTDVSELKEKLEELTDGSTQLVEGTAEFSDYMGQLSTATDQLESGASSVNTYMGTLSSGMSQLNSSVAELPEGTSQLLQGVEAVNVALKSGYTGTDSSKYGIYEALSQIASGASTISTAAEGMMNGASQIADGADQISAGAKSGYTGDDTSKYGIYEAANLVETGLASAMAQLQTNLTSASENLGTANGYSAQAASALTVIKDGDNLTAEQKAAITGALTAIGASEQYVSGVQQALNNANLDMTEVNAALEKIKAGAESIAEAADQISVGAKSGYTGTDTSYYGIYETVAAVKSGADDLTAAAVQLMSAIDTMTGKSNMGAIIDGLETLDSQSATLVSAIEQLSSGASELSTGTGTLSSGMSDANSAVKQLYESSVTIKDGMAQLDSEGISQIASLVDGDLSEIVERIQALEDIAGDSYSYSGCPDGVECSTKFIFKTDEISAE